MRWSRYFDATGLALLGFLYGVVVGLLAFRLCGFGHGWCAANVTAWGALPLAAFGAALAHGGRIVGRVLLAIVAISMVSIDGCLFVAARYEGFDYLRRVWESRNGFAIWLLWLLMWLAWQVHVLWAVAREIGAGLRSLPRRVDLK